MEGLAMSSRAYGAARSALKQGALVLALISGVFTAIAPAQAQEVVMLGDSLTQGYGLPEDEGLVPQLQAWLDAEGVEAQLVNMGVSGDTTSGGLSRVAWSLTPETKAVVVALGGNDLLRGLDPKETRANLDAILAEITGQKLPVLLLGLPAPSNYGADWAVQFDAIFPELAEKYGVLMDPNQLAPLAAFSPEERAARGLMQSDGIHPSKEGVAMEVEHIGPLVKQLIEQIP
ncbi:arylesterase [Albirhodobacter sp. R86504]|uniref:arylesterase n=1 Tax=Albirhodobacter sp. R86504 TaxID=3093848 RepID=UPI00367193C2